MKKHIGILTAGGDTPGLNSAIRAIGKSAIRHYNWQVTGFKEGFRGLVHNRYIRMGREEFSGILTKGGTILGTSRDKPHKMMIGDKKIDMTSVIIENYRNHNLDCLVCLGGGGTQKNAYRLAQAGLNIITLPKTIDNDVWGTDITFGYDTALGIATESIDRLHSTAHSHHRIIVVEIMGHRAGWLALGAGLAGGADVVLLPEIPFYPEKIADAIKGRKLNGSPFSIVAISEGAMSMVEATEYQKLNAAIDNAERGSAERDEAKAKMVEFERSRKGAALRLAGELEHLTGLEARLTILGHVQRGGTPSARDRLLATQLGTATTELVEAGKFGSMVSIQGDDTRPIPLGEIAGKKKLVPLDLPQLMSARQIGTCFGD
ncbi:MAG: ATP-dependent 6-phosphofructokinase [Chloroflexota bacterium]